MKLSGIEIRNFRSIGNDSVELKPWKKCNILIGQNNAGKSNVIRAIKKIATAYHKRQPRVPALIAELQRDEFHRLDTKEQFSFSLYFSGETSKENEVQLMETLGLEELYFIFSNKQGEQALAIEDFSFANIENRRLLDFLYKELTGSDLSRHVTKEKVREIFLKDSYRYFFKYCNQAFPEVQVIPVFRQIQPGQEYQFNGARLIQLLGQYQHPARGNDSERDKFDRIQAFTRRLLHLPEAELEVTHDNELILIKNDGLRLELEAYGTGVHELIILVTAILSIENSICCIEEPEIHLHPTLQREFIRFLVEETSNQYLISTHSPTFINAHVNMPAKIAEQIQVFHVQLRDGATLGHPVLEDEQSLVALNDLGVHASDILQSNCVIWVEGPSDRVYINHWLSLVAPDLIEGLHYSIMFYGGRLLSHLSVLRENSNDKVPEELVDVLKINQNAIVIMDSDRAKPRARLNATKMRVRDECEKSSGLCWVTDGREIENYLLPEVLGVTLGIDSSLFSVGPYDKLEVVIETGMKKAKEKPIRYASDKVGYARDFIEHFEKDHIKPDLQTQLKKVVDKINYWNDQHVT